ncbi:GreA/GreB family elongation factor [Halomonas sp. M20]|uniref:GreA/GreB family elongation factor n=1 Tax=Halomonas sp. M20 TaxID=2763264 RepID=UPI001D0A90B7|nr:GreA/GreB family elongation factor [Halomonas sp. M20]
MSRAFVKEDSDAPDTPPERAVSSLPNYMTPTGYRALQQWRADLIAERNALQEGDLQAQSQIPVLERDIRYCQARLQSAKVIEPRDEAPQKVIFGCRVSFTDDEDRAYQYRIVGEDEALSQGDGEALVSWASPLGGALLGCEEGDVTTWPKPSGDIEIEITAIAP